MATSLRHRIRPWLVSLLLVAAPVGVLSAQAADQGASASTPAQGTDAANVAMGYVGSSYQLGGTGPTFFDMPGLTEAAWANVGVNLPHSVRAQFAAGTQIPPTEIEPGDLVFYYSNTEGIYVGDGKIVVADEVTARVVTKYVAQLSGTTLTYVRPDQSGS